jgi:ABC-type sugar transport system substrate-binding protein
MAGAKRIRLFLVRADDTQLGWASQARQATQENGLEYAEEWSEDPSEQTHQIAECIWKDLADALIILPASRSGPAALMIQALAHGKSVVLINQTRGDFDPQVEWSLPRLRQAYPKLLTARVSPDETEIGRMQGRQIRALLPKGGRVLSVRGDTFSPTATCRTQGLEEILGSDHRYVFAKVSADWTAPGGRKAVSEWVRARHASPDLRIDLVCSQSDVMLPGIREALAGLAKEMNRPDFLRIPLTGCDGLEDVKRDIAAGRAAATVEQPSRTAPAVQLCAAFFRSGVIPQNPDVSLKPSSYPNLEDLAGRSG